MQTGLEERKEKLLLILKSKIFYLLATIVVFIGAHIRTRNLYLLKDKLLLALDPYVFLRYSKYLLEHGHLMTWDTMRYVPLGYNPANTGSLLSYIIVYTYKFVDIFSGMTFEKFNILYPVIAFVLAMIVFFFLVKKLFDIKIATLATAYLSVLPGFIYRTTAGFSEKEPIGILFLFLSFFLFLCAFNEKNIKKSLIFGVFAGLFSSLLATIWGGADFIFIIIPVFALIAFFFNKTTKRHFYVYLIWSIIILISTWLRGFPISSLFSSFTTLLVIFVAFSFIVNYLLFDIDLFKLKDKLKHKFPSRVTSLFVSLLLSAVFSSIIVSPFFIFNNISDLIQRLIHPFGTGRFVLTVAEAHQPYFTDWKSNFYSFFYLFFLGSILLFYNFIKPLGKKYSYPLTILYAAFISAFIFSRYSTSSMLNGENSISIWLYLGSLVIFTLVLFGVKIYTFSKDKEVFQKFKNINTNYIFVFIWFLLMVVGARGAMRLFFTFAPITAVLGAYFVMEIYDYIKENKKLKFPYNQILAGVFIVLILVLPVQGSFYSLAKMGSNSVKYTGPSFNAQWEKAMDWVKEETPEDAVFAHWWDYGYWVQTMGERATILDGGNAITYWDYLMGRHVLTGHSSGEALEMLKSHNATHLLIISDEIGKYPAYSSIGSDLNYDRYSYLSQFMYSPDEVQETRNQILNVYKGQFVLDQDFVYNNQILSKGSSAIVGFIVPFISAGETTDIEQPTAVVINNNKRVDIPVECVVFGDKEHNYDTPGLKGCLFFVPSYNTNTQALDYKGTLIYISEKVRKTLFTQLYLFGKEWEGFKLVYDDSTAGYPLVFIANQGRIVGPLRIWEVSYPPGTKINPVYLQENYPDTRLSESG